MTTNQPEILAPIPALARFLVLGLLPGADPRPGIERLARLSHGDGLIVGFGAPLVLALEGPLARLRPFPAVSGPGVSFPSTQGSVWICLTGSDAGVLLGDARRLVTALGDVYRIDEDVLAFRHGTGRDLSGYEDGTENPKGKRAAEVALVSGAGEGLDGGSFVAAQRWVHDLRRFENMTASERDLVIGRDHETNEELNDAPAFAHVKRAAQESFDPEAFMLRRSMPWGSVADHGLYFVAFGASLDPFERVMMRMAGLEDGIVDGLLRFTHPVSGGYYFCPPLRDGRLDLRALGL